MDLQTLSARLLTTKTIGVFTVNVANQLLSFALFILLARVLGVYEFGLFMVAWSWLRILMIGGKAGLDQSAIKLVPQYLAQKDWPSIKDFLRFGRTATIGMSLVIALIALLCVSWTDQQTPSNLYAYAFAIIPLWALIQFDQSILRSFGLTQISTLPEGIARPALQIAAIAFAIISLNTAPTAQTAMIASICAFGITACLAHIFTISRTPPELKSAQKSPQSSQQKPSANRKEWIGLSFTLMLLSGGMILMKNADIVMISAFIGPEQAGLYSAATRLAMLCTFVLTAVNMVIAPQISTLYQAQKRVELQTLLRHAALLIALATLPIALILILGANLALGLFGADFIAANQALYILTGAQLFNALSGSVGFIMTMTGHHKRAAIYFTLALAANLILNAVLIPMWGINGAAIATASSTLLWNIMLCLYVVKHLRLNPTILPLIRS
jgi:O-antigen/teichoic acid export membrane protein